MDKRKIIIDTDPGIDDCFAIMCAINSKAFDILGITCVAGNKSLPLVTKNALRIVDFENVDIPVVKGAKASLLKLKAGEEQENVSADCHGADGMGQSELPYSERCLIQQEAYEFILDKIKEYPDEIEIICLGPMTNLALAIEKDVETMKKLKSITFMGGAFFVPGNIGEHAEYNAAFDAESLEMILKELSNDVDVRIVGIDASNKVVLSHGYLDFLSFEGGQRGILMEKISRAYIHHYYQLNKAIGAIIHDLYCMLSCIDPSLINKKDDLKIKIHTTDIHRGWTEPVENGYKITAITDFKVKEMKRLFLDIMMPDKKDIIDEIFPQL